MKKLTGYVVLAALVVIVFLVINAPATIVTRLIDRAQSGVQLSSVHGSAWEGGATLSVAMPQGMTTELGQLTWELAPGALLRGSITADVDLRGQQATAAGAGWATTSRQGLRRLDGVLPTTLINQYAQRYEIAIQNDIRLNGVSVTMRPPADQGHAYWQVEDADGELTWGGGEVRWALGQQQHRAVLPPLVGTLTVEAGALLLTVRDPGQLILAKLLVAPSGQVTAQATRALLSATGTPWPGNQAPEAVVVEVEEKLF